MKKLFTLSMVILITFSVFAQAPQKMSYQCVIRNGSGVLVTNQGVGIRISILQGSVTGTEIYEEIYNPNPQTNVNGLVTIEIGGGIPITGTFSTIDWSVGPIFLKTETDPTGGTNYTISGTSQLLSVPYALLSKYSESANDAVKLTGNQIIDGNKTFNGTTTVLTPVNATDATTKAYVDNALKELGLIPNNYSGLVSDIEGNTYKTVTIGTQIWMAENLRVGSYNNGSSIPYVSNDLDWANLTVPGYCWYNNEVLYKPNYGALYNWYVAGTGNLCPVGWHVPNDAEWTTLINYLGGISVTGGKLKELGTAHWNSPNIGATNETGFTALPDGSRNLLGTFLSIGVGSAWWSATETGTISASLYMLNYNYSDLLYNNLVKWNGLPVRCVKAL